jgi:Lysozyme inhibitor LprI
VRRHGQVVRQRIANPLPPVRIWVPPLLTVHDTASARLDRSLAPLSPVKRLLLLALLLPIATTAARAEPGGHRCPGDTTVEMRDCASRAWEQSTTRLQRKIPAALLTQWQAATRAVCAKAYAPYKDGTIYPQLVVGCDDHLNRALLREFRGLEAQAGER